MTEETVIPTERDDYRDADFKTATRRVHAARDKLLKLEGARNTHDTLLRTVEERVAERKASLAQVRKAIGLTQAQVAATLGIDQAEVSKMERRANLQLATLARFIEATGGALRISVVYGDVEVPVNLGDLLSEDQPGTTPATTARPAARGRAKEATSGRAALKSTGKRQSRTGRTTIKDPKAGSMRASPAKKR